MTGPVNVLDRPEGLMRSEMEVLRELVRLSSARNLLEIGMANGSSTVAMLEVLQQAGGGHVTSIDPYQLHPVSSSPSGVPGYGGEGVKCVQSAGFAEMHTLIAQPDYLAMPKLVGAARTFDFVFIDGYHSFDYVLLDFFYADLLLRKGGVVVFHDTNRLPVFRVCTFLEANKPYRRVGPPLLLRHESPVRRALRRVWHLASGQAGRFAERRSTWKSLAAFTKEADVMADENVLKAI